MKKTICLLLAALLLVSLMAAAFATPTISLTIDYKNRTKRAYGPSVYQKKAKANSHWDISYIKSTRDNIDHYVGVYVWERNIAKRVTHTELLEIWSGTQQYRYINSGVKKGSPCKVVMELNRDPDGGQYTYLWNP